MTQHQPILDQNICKRFTLLRKLAKLTQKQLADLIGYSQLHIWKFENGHVPIPIYVINMVTQNARLLGIFATTEWILLGRGNEPYFDSNFNNTIDSYTERNIQDPLTHFFTHALSLSKIYKEKLTLFVGGVDFEPYITAGTFIIAEKIDSLEFNPLWGGFYLYQFNDVVIPVKLIRTPSILFKVISLHEKDKKRLHLSEQDLNSIYPAIGTLSRYQIASSEAEDIAHIIQKQSISYTSNESVSDLIADEA